jgi:putative MATE family efflux protein
MSVASTTAIAGILPSAAADAAQEMAPRTRAMLDGPIVPVLLRLAAPNFIVMATQIVVGVVETYFVGWLGADALAGVSLAFPLLMLMQTMAAGGVGGSVASTIARALGGGERDKADALAFHALLIALGFGLVFMIAELIGGRALFRAMGGTGDALAIASMYAAILFGGAPLFWLFNILASILRGAGVMVLPAAVSIAGAVVTLTISPALIVGLGPIPKLGVPGAACAMLGFYAVASTVLGGVLLFGGAPVRLRRAVRVQWSMLGDILRVGLPGAMITLLTNTTVLLLTGLVGPFGTKAIAGYGMGARLEYIQISIVFGLGTALVTMVGTNFGAGNIRRAERVAWTGAAFAGCLTGTIGMIFAVDPHLWLDTFSKDPAVFDAGMRYLRIVAPAYGIYGAGLALYFSSLGTGRVLWAVASSILRLVVAVGAGSVAVRFFGGGLDSVYLAMAAGLVVLACGTALPIALGSWRRR